MKLIEKYNKDYQVSSDDINEQITHAENDDFVKPIAKTRKRKSR